MRMELQRHEVPMVLRRGGVGPPPEREWTSCRPAGGANSARTRRLSAASARQPFEQLDLASVVEIVGGDAEDRVSHGVAAAFRLRAQAPLG
jgi:hypothetical protein